MADIAALGLRVDGVENLDKATQSLNNFAEAESGAQKAATGLGTSTRQAKPAIDGLAAASAKAAADQAKLEAAAAKSGMSVKQLQFALRGVPAQFTDIAISLQGGMNPLTVFLQQGGQLKDMFGGAVPAVRALGGYIIGLINPLTVAATAIAALGAAYYSGSKEADNFRKSLATTGNAAGLTVSQLQGMAASMSEVRGTTGQAAEALAVMVSAGVRADSQLKSYTETALRWSKATGEGVDVVAERFVALQKDPLTAALKLNETTNFLTASVYDQVKALEEQGNTTEAARVAMDAYSSAMSASASNIEKNLGSLERGWNAVAGAAKGAWDWMLNVGRQASLIDRLAEEQARLLELETQTVGLYERGTYSKRLADQRARVTALMDEVAAEEANAAGKKEAARQVAAKAAWDKISVKSLSDEEKLNRDLAAARKAATDAGTSEADLKKVLAKIQEDYDKKQKKPSGGGAGVSELAQIQARVHATQQLIKALQEQGAQAERITEGERLAYKIQQEIDSGKLTSSQRVQKQRELEAAVSLKAAEEQLRFEKERASGEQQNIDTLTQLATKIQLAALHGEELAKVQASLALNQYATPEQIEAVQKMSAELFKLEEQQRKRKEFGEGKKADKFILGNVDPLSGGAFDEQLARYEAEKEREIARYEEAQERLQLARELQIETNRSYDELEAEQARQHADRLQQIDSARYSVMLTSAGSAFGNLAEILKNSQGEQSSAYRAMFAVSKAFAVADATMNAYNAISKAWASAPFPANLAAVAMTAPAVFGVVSAIQGSNLKGMAHDGIDAVPETGTWLLEKGERVTTANTSASLDSTLARIDSRMSGNSGGGMASPNVNLNVQLVGGAFEGAQVTQEYDEDQEAIILRVVSRDIAEGGPISRSGQRYMGWNRVGT